MPKSMQAAQIGFCGFNKLVTRSNGWVWMGLLLGGTVGKEWKLCKYSEISNMKFSETAITSVSKSSAPFFENVF